MKFFVILTFANYYIDSVDKVKMPSEKIKFLEEQCLIIQNNKEELEKQLNEINKSKAESEPKNNLLQQKLIQLNKLEESLNVIYLQLYLFHIFIKPDS